MIVKKVIKNIWILFLLCLGMVLFGGEEAQAKRLLSKSKSLQAGKTYHYDIDGDKKKESIRLVTKRQGNAKVTSTLYVDRVKYYQLKEKGVDCGHVADLCDLYSKKKGMNLILYTLGSSDRISCVRVIQCGKKKGKLIAAMNSGMKGMMEFYRVKGKVIQNKEEGAFTLNVDTPFYLNYFGCYYAKIKWKIAGKEIQPIVQTDYTYNMKYTFTLRKSIIAYDIPDTLKGDPSVLDAGTKLSVLAVRPRTWDTDSETHTSYVKIKTSRGKIYWIYDEPVEPMDATAYYFKEIPAWG